MDWWSGFICSFVLKMVAKHRSFWLFYFGSPEKCGAFKNDFHFLFPSFFLQFFFFSLRKSCNRFFVNFSSQQSEKLSQFEKLSHNFSIIWAKMRKEKENIILMRNSNWLLFLQILDAVRYLHEIGVVHRDLKLGKWNISNVDHISRYVLLKKCTLVSQMIFFSL